MRLYFAGPLFTAPERAWNAELADGLRAAGHEVFLPQDQEVGKPPADVFATDVGGIEWADAVIAITDGPDPDSGTSWESGYAFGKKPIVLVRTDFRRITDGWAGYNPMLTESATVRLDLPLASIEDVAEAVLAALRGLGARG